MKKKQLLAAVFVSTLALAQAGLVSADETSTSPVDGTTPVVVLPAPTPVDQVQPSQPVETPTTGTTKPSSTETPVDPTVPSTNQTPSDHTDVSTSQKDKNQGTKVDSNTPNQPGQTLPTNAKGKENTNSQEGTPSEETKTTDQANQQGLSQVGTISNVTGQVVRDVTQNNPVELDNGVIITDIQNGVATLSNGSKSNLTDLGAQKNADNTYTVKTKDGKTETLPHTGEESGLLASIAGLALMALSAFGYRKVK